MYNYFIVCKYLLSQGICENLRENFSAGFCEKNLRDSAGKLICVNLRENFSAGKQTRIVNQVE